eukprot:COSAG06_NODE_4727_length_3951_cov_2.075897_3_plen_174_part_00
MRTSIHLFHVDKHRHTCLLIKCSNVQIFIAITGCWRRWRRYVPPTLMGRRWRWSFRIGLRRCQNLTPTTLRNTRAHFCSRSCSRSCSCSCFLLVRFQCCDWFCRLSQLVRVCSAFRFRFAHPEDFDVVAMAPDATMAHDGTEPTVSISRAHFTSTLCLRALFTCFVHVIFHAL